MATGVMDPRTISIYSALTRAHWEGVTSEQEKRQLVDDELQAGGLDPLGASERLPKFTPRTRRAVTNRAAYHHRQTNVTSGGAWRPTSRRQAVIERANADYSAWLEAHRNGETNLPMIATREEWTAGALAEAGLPPATEAEMLHFPTPDADRVVNRGVLGCK